MNEQPVDPYTRHESALRQHLRRHPELLQDAEKAVTLAMQAYNQGAIDAQLEAGNRIRRALKEVFHQPATRWLRDRHRPKDGKG